MTSSAAGCLNIAAYGSAATGRDCVSTAKTAGRYVGGWWEAALTADGVEASRLLAGHVGIGDAAARV